MLRSVAAGVYVSNGTWLRQRVWCGVCVVCVVGNAGVVVVVSRWITTTHVACAVYAVVVYVAHDVFVVYAGGVCWCRCCS